MFDFQNYIPLSTCTFPAGDTYGLYEHSCTYIYLHFFKGVAHDEETDIDEIPGSVPCGVYKPVSPGVELSYITVDLETTNQSEYCYKEPML